MHISLTPHLPYIHTKQHRHIYTHMRVTCYVYHHVYVHLIQVSLSLDASYLFYQLHFLSSISLSFLCFLSPRRHPSLPLTPLPFLRSHSTLSLPPSFPPPPPPFALSCLSLCQTLSPRLMHTGTGSYDWCDRKRWFQGVGDWMHEDSTTLNRTQRVGRDGWGWVGMILCRCSFNKK